MSFGVRGGEGRRIRWISNRERGIVPRKLVQAGSCEKYSVIRPSK
jgi:hypothetical protein